MVLSGGRLVVSDMFTINGDLDCSDGNCPTKSKAVLFDFEKNRVCSVDDSDDGGGDDGGDDGGGDGSDGDGHTCTASVREM